MPYGEAHLERLFSHLKYLLFGKKIINTSIKELQKRLTEKTLQLDNARDYIKITKAYIAYKQYNTATDRDLAYSKCVLRQDIVNDTNCKDAYQKVINKDRLGNQDLPDLYAAKLFDVMDDFDFNFNFKV